VDGLGKEGFSDTGFSDDHEGLRVGGELGDSGPEFGNCRAASYEVQRGQR
jgi:hypothetical protein